MRPIAPRGPGRAPRTYRTDRASRTYRAGGVRPPARAALNGVRRAYPCKDLRTSGTPVCIRRYLRVLRCLVIPSGCGDSIRAPTAHAYDVARGLGAVHLKSGLSGRGVWQRPTETDTQQRTRHMVRTHNTVGGGR